MKERNRAKQRRKERRLARKLFKSGTKQPPEVFVAYLQGLVRGTELRQAQELAIRDIPMMDIFGQRVSGLGVVRAPADEGEYDALGPKEPDLILH